MSRKDQLFTRIAREQLQIETLELRNRDHLDFHDVSVIGVRRALEAAYEAGRKAARRPQRDEAALQIGQRVRVVPLEETGQITAAESDELILVVQLDSGETVHVPTADCEPVDHAPQRTDNDLLAAAEALASEQANASEQIEHYQRLAECWRRLRQAIRHAKKQNALPRP